MIAIGTQVETFKPGFHGSLPMNRAYLNLQDFRLLDC